MKTLLATVLLALLSGCAATNADKVPTYFGVMCFVEDNGKNPTDWGLARVKFQYDETHKLIVVRQSMIESYGKNQCLVLH